MCLLGENRADRDLLTEVFGLWTQKWNNAAFFTALLEDQMGIGCCKAEMHIKLCAQSQERGEHTINVS